MYIMFYSDDSEEEMYFDLDNQSVAMSMTSSLSSTNTARSSAASSMYQQNSVYLIKYNKYIY